MIKNIVSALIFLLAISSFSNTAIAQELTEKQIIALKYIVTKVIDSDQEGEVLGASAEEIESLNPGLVSLGAPWPMFYEDYADDGGTQSKIDITDFEVFSEEGKQKLFLTSYDTNSTERFHPIFWNIETESWEVDQVEVSAGVFEDKELPQEGVNRLRRYNDEIYFNSLDSLGGGIKMFRRDIDGVWTETTVASGQHSRDTFAFYDEASDNKVILVNNPKVQEISGQPDWNATFYPATAVSENDGVSFISPIVSYESEGDPVSGGFLTYASFNGAGYIFQPNYDPAYNPSGQPDAVFLSKYDHTSPVKFVPIAQSRDEVLPPDPVYSFPSSYSLPQETAEVSNDGVPTLIITTSGGKLYSTTGLTPETTIVLHDSGKDMFQSTDGTVYFIEEPSNNTQSVFKTSNGVDKELVVTLDASVETFRALAVVDNYLYLGVRNPEDSVYRFNLNGSEEPPQTCTPQVTSTATTPQGFATPFAPTTQTLALTTTCNNDDIEVTLGINNQSDIIYNTGYYWDGSNWETITYEATPGNTTQGAWIRGQATASLPKAELTYPGYILGYMCRFTSGYQCSPTWMIQIVE